MRINLARNDAARSIAYLASRGCRVFGAGSA